MEIDVIEHSVINSKINFIINPTFWENIDDSVKSVVNTKWEEIKFFTDEKEQNSQINLLPNDKGGIYIFVVKPNIIPDTHLYIMYIGRAHISSSQNLRKRCKCYYNESRPKLKRMIEHWWKYIYVRYLPLENNDLINKVEAELINKIVPPCNDEIPNQEIRNAVKAFSM